MIAHTWECHDTRSTAKTGLLTSTIKPHISFGNDKSWKWQSDTYQSSKERI